MGWKVEMGDSEQVTLQESERLGMVEGGMSKRCRVKFANIIVSVSNPEKGVEIFSVTSC